MSTRSVASLQVRASVRQVDAHEPGGFRYLAYVLITGAVSWLLIAQTAAQISTGVPLVIGVVALLNLVLFRPWHLALNVDMDTSTCRVEVRMFGVILLRRRSYELDGHRFAVVDRHETKQVKEDSGLGCLMIALPFPLSLIAMLFGGGGSGPQHESWTELCLRTPGRGSVEGLLRIRKCEVVGPLLDAVGDLLPSHVE